MSAETKHSLRQLDKAFNQLRKGITQANNDLAKDGVVQRFEFTFELLWKTLKIILHDKGIVTTNPKDCFLAAFRQGWIKDDLVYTEMLEARNRMSHEYDEAEAKKVFKKIKQQFIKPIKALIDQLEIILK